jgi:Phage tail protein
MRPLPLGAGSYNGLTWGPGTWLQVVTGDGYDETPNVVTADMQRTMMHGAWTGPDWFGPRTVNLTFVVLGNDNQDLRNKLQAIELAWLPDSTDRPLVMFDGTRSLTARIRKRLMTHPVGGRETYTTLVVQWFAADPFFHEATQTAILFPDQITGGLSWPLSWPLTWGSRQSGGASIVNTGPMPSNPKIVIAGPALNPAVTNLTLAARLLVNTQLNQGDVLVIDCDTRSITLRNGPSRDASLDPSSRWFSLIPGINQLSYNSGSGGATESATVVWSTSYP